jgi:hypothetical protein
LGDGVQQTAAT